MTKCRVNFGRSAGHNLRCVSAWPPSECRLSVSRVHDGIAKQERGGGQVGREQESRDIKKRYEDALIFDIERERKREREKVSGSLFRLCWLTPRDMRPGHTASPWQLSQQPSLFLSSLQLSTTSSLLLFFTTSCSLSFLSLSTLSLALAVLQSFLSVCFSVSLSFI